MSYRLQRLGREMQKSISEIIKFKIKDPRVSEVVSILDVTVSKDLKTAKVRVSIYGEKETESFEALNKSAGYIRKELAQDFKDIRSIPQLNFVLDKSVEYSKHITKILDEINKDKPNQ